MKICYFANAASLHTVRWARYFAEKGHELYLISPRPLGSNKIENVGLYVLDKVSPSNTDCIFCHKFALLYNAGKKTNKENQAGYSPCSLYLTICLFRGTKLLPSFHFERLGL